MAAADKLAVYRSKRDFSVTREPAEGGKSGKALSFVVQKHWASSLHYDFRLELDGVMLSWAVPKGPSYDPHDKRMAIHVEDHPISYSSFEGSIPEGQYGAGQVIVWDAGTWHPIGDPDEGLRNGDLKFELKGKKLLGKWVLVRIKNARGKQEAWLLIKEKDAYIKPAAEFSVTEEFPDSILGYEPKLSDSATVPKAAPAKKTAPSKSSAKAPGKAAAKSVKSPAKSTGKALPAGMPPGAEKAALPAKFSPQLATLVDGPPPDPENWVYEIKFDGYRLLTRVEGGEAKLFTRNGNDWTHRLDALHASILKAGLPDGWYDGEIVVLSSHGVPDFGALQNSFDTEKTKDVAYYLFDVPFLDGYDLRQVPVVARRELLRQALAKDKSGALRFSDVFDAPPASVVTSACQLGLEGVIAKRKDSTYSSSRSSSWIKLKCSHRQEFVIGGWTDPKGSRTGLGSLLLGVHDDDGNLVYAGNVGTGFNQKNLGEVSVQLEKAASDKSPFASRDGIVGRPHWVKPILVAEVTFGEWTHDNHIRHSVFHGLRTDKPPKSIVRETAVSAPKAAKLKPSAKAAVEAVSPEAGGADAAPNNADAKVKAAAAPARATEPPALYSRFKVTHPERVIDKSSGATKLDLVTHYAAVAGLMMEHLKGRPVALVRAPAGVGGQLFFQKHAEVEKLPGIRQLDPALYISHPAMLEVSEERGVLSAAQWNVIEFHTLNTGTTSFEHPDRLVFDLDPGEGVDWKMIQSGADTVRIMLKELGLPCFLKTSGGKGLHVVVPIKPDTGWEEAKGFSQAVVQHLAGVLPEQFVAKSGGKNRVGKIFIDWLRNGLGASTACAWSARARPGLGVSIPVDWSELADLTGGAHWTISNLADRLRAGNGPWKAYAKSAKGLAAAMKKLGYQG